MAGNVNLQNDKFESSFEFRHAVVIRHMHAICIRVLCKQVLFLPTGRLLIACSGIRNLGQYHLMKQCQFAPAAAQPLGLPAPAQGLSLIHI